MTTKARGAFRVWSNNANGLSLSNNGAAIHTLCSSLSEYHIDCIALQEPNLDFAKPWVRQKFQSIIKEHFPTAQLILSSSRVIVDPDSPWKPGGTALIILGKWASATVQMKHDPLGRWTRATLSGLRPITIYSMYNVVPNRIAQAGPATAFAQQHDMLRLAGVLSPNPRLQFIHDLAKDLSSTLQNSKAAILVGDLNEPVGHDLSLFATIASDQDLFDVHDTLLGDAANIPTYQRGHRRLDYCFASRSLRPYLSACGYNLFNQVLHSDHRALYVDFFLAEFLGKTAPIIATPSTRQISSQSREVKRFVEFVHSHLQQNRFFQALDTYYESFHSHPAPWIQANHLDALMGQAIASAVRRCAHPTRPPWSAPLHRASLKLRFWKTYKTSQCTTVDQSTVLKALSQRIWHKDTPHHLPKTRSGILRVIRNAQTQLRHLRRTAFDERQVWLREQQETVALRVSPAGTEPEKARQQLLTRLRSRRRFKNIQRALKPVTTQALTQVEILSERSHLDPSTGRTRTITARRIVNTREALESAIRDRNKKHFAQAYGTPWTKAPLSAVSSSNNFDLVSDSNGNPITLPADAFTETKTVVDILRERATATGARWDPETSFDEFISGLLHWREATATSPSGRHLGVYRALTTAHCNSSGEFGTADQELDLDAPTIQEQATEILRAIHGLANSAAVGGFYLRRWTQVVNVMIYKKPGCIELDKLRVIHLFEADFNLMIGILFGRRAMYHQSDNGLLHPGQYGQPGGECQDAAMCKVLHNHIAHFSKTPLGQFESDAKACFDRIVMDFALLCFHSTGAPPGPLRMWEQTLFHIIHTVKTAFGTSQLQYGYEPDSPIIGPGQGSRGGPASCATSTGVLIEAMDRLCHGLSFCNPSQDIHYTAVVKMFIDDATNSTNRFKDWLHSPPSADTLLQMLQHDAQTWERCLFTSGGLLNLGKCLFYLMLWRFDSEGRASLVPATELPDMTLTSGYSSQPSMIRPTNCSDPHKYLGDTMAPNLQMKSALNILQEKVRQYSTRLLTGNIDRRDTWIAYFAVLIPGLTYTLSVSHHRIGTLDKLQSPATRATLLRLGFNRNTAKAVVYGPARFGGLGFRHLAVEQGIAATLVLLRHIRAKTDLGNLLRIALSWWQLTVGQSTPLLADITLELPHIQWNWFSCLRAFLRRIHASVILPSAMQGFPPPLRERDVCIMDVIHRHPRITKSTLAAFNRCRHYLAVTWLSEIATQNGRSISRGAWTGSLKRSTTLLWPYQPKPGPKSFRVWRRLLSDCFLQAHTPTKPNRADLLLINRLGPCLQSAPPLALPLPDSWDDFIAALPHWESSLLSNTTFHDTPTLAHHLHHSSTLCLASDGGAIPGRASFGALIATNDTILVECGGRVPGADPRCFRAESYASLAVLCLLSRLLEFYQISNPHLWCTLYTDSQSEIDRLQSLQPKYPKLNPRSTLLAESDVILQVLHRLDRLDPQVQFVHVKGHQDQDTSWNRLSWPAKLNVTCDRIAGRYLRPRDSPIHSVPHLPASSVALEIKGTTITHHIPTHLRTAAGLLDYKDHCANRCQWDDLSVFDSIDWELYHSTHRRFSFLKKLFLTKWLHDLLPLQARQFKISQSPSPLCPSSCGCTETRPHFLRCPHPDRIRHWRDFIPSLVSLAKTNKLDPYLRRLMLVFVDPLAGNVPPDITGLPSHYHDLLIRQQRIGPDSFLLGWLHTDWVQLQHQFLVARKLPHNHNQAFNSIGAILSLVLEQIHSLWLLRNTHLHGSTESTSPAYIRSHLLLQLEHLYAQREQCLHTDQHLFMPSLAWRRDNQSVPDLQRTVTRLKHLVPVSVKDASAIGPGGQRISSFFPVIRHHTSPRM